MARGKPRARDPRLEKLESVARALQEAPKAPPPPIELTEAQLMQAAFDALGNENALDWSRIRIIAAPAAPAERPQSERAQPEQEVAKPAGPRAAPPPKVGQAAGWTDSVPSAADLERVAARARAQRLPELNLRYLELAEALAQLDDFVTMLVLAGVEFARIITGKGISSPAGPVIRPQAVEWCRASPSVHRVIEELDHYGEVGTLLVQIRRDWG